MIKMGINKYRFRGTPGKPGEPLRRILAVDCLGDRPVAAECMDGTIVRRLANGLYRLDGIKSDMDLIEIIYNDIPIDIPGYFYDFTHKGPSFTQSAAHKGYFAGVDIDGRPMSFDGGKTSWTSTDRPIVWDHFEPAGDI